MAKKRNNLPQSPEAPREGEAAPTAMGSLDLADKKDRALLRNSANRRWPTSEEMKGRAVGALDRAMTTAGETGDVGQIVDCVRTLAALEKQNQDDEHLAEKHGRIDLGKATERVDGAVRAIVMRVVGPTQSEG